MVNNSLSFGTSDTAIITVHPLPIVDLGADTVLHTPFDSVTLNAGQGFTSYYWSTGDTSQTLVVNGWAPPSDSTFWVVVTDNYGCSNSDTIRIDMFIDGVEDYNKSTLQCSVYPNPAKDYVIIKTSGVEINSIKLTSLSGLLINNYVILYNNIHYML